MFNFVTKKKKRKEKRKREREKEREKEKEKKRERERRRRINLYFCVRIVFASFNDQKMSLSLQHSNVVECIKFKYL
jgi:hypothetical protein